MFRSQAVLLAKMVDGRGVFYELIRPADANNRHLDSFLAEQFQNGASVTAHQDMILQSHHYLRNAAEASRQILVQRLGKTGIDDGAVESFGGEDISGLLGHLLHIAEREEGDLVSPAV